MDPSLADQDHIKEYPEEISEQIDLFLDALVRVSEGIGLTVKQEQTWVLSFSHTGKRCCSGTHICLKGLKEYPDY
jgi:hypothetical protein